jgi:hypothetical protein
MIILHRRRRKVRSSRLLGGTVREKFGELTADLFFLAFVAHSLAPLPIEGQTSLSLSIPWFHEILRSFILSVFLQVLNCAQTCKHCGTSRPGAHGTLWYSFPTYGYEAEDSTQLACKYV